MRTIEKLGGDKYPEQINVPVDRDLKERARRLKYERRINVTAEIRKAIKTLFDELEQSEAS
jgi:post-segregation antitoxin (ccd killing protein)